jgi:hypothetical protein
MYLAGSFQGWNAVGTPMVDSGGGVWSVQLDLLGGAEVAYKFLAGPDWVLGESVPMECGVDDGFGGNNRVATIGTTSNVLPVVCFGSCGECTGVVDPPLEGWAFCGPGTVWDETLELCIGITTCSEDVDGDGLVGVSDVLALLSAFGGLCP